MQAEPPFDAISHQLIKPNVVLGGITTRTVGTWHLLGPVNSAETGMSISGNRGGYVYLNRIDPTNTQKMFVSFITGGLWMTTDGGTSWTLTDANMPAEKYYDIDVCTSSPQILYAISQSRVIKSTDGGLNWANTSLTTANYPNATTPYDIAVSSSNPNIVMVKWGDKMYRTTDGGTTWAVVLSSLPTPDDYATGDCSANSELLNWSTTESGVVYFLSISNDNRVVVYRSNDSGNSFSILTTITLDLTANGQVVGWAKLLLPSNNATAIYVRMHTVIMQFNSIS